MAYPGPGPSSYYAHQHSHPPHPHTHQQTPPPGAPGGPPPHHVYGTHSPVPGTRPTYYQYPPPGPPLPQQHHIGSPGLYPTHTPPPIPPQTLPQNPRGGHRGGYNRGGGGAHHYYHHHHQPHYPQQPQHYYPQPPPPQQQTPQPPQQPLSQPPQQPSYANHVHPNHIHPHIVPPPISIHPPQHLPYAPQSATGISSAKYSSYSPSLSTATTSYSPSTSTSSYMPSPSAPVFTPSWQTRQALAAGMGMAGGIGPLPKQLSMPPPVTPMAGPEFVPNGNGNAFYGAEPETPNKTEQREVTAQENTNLEVEGDGTQTETEAEKQETKIESSSGLPPVVPTFSAAPPTPTLDSSSLPAAPAPNDSTATIISSSTLPLPPPSQDSGLTSMSTPPSSMSEIAPIPTSTTTTTITHQPTSSFTQIGSISTTIVASSSSLITAHLPSASSSSSASAPSSSLSSTSSPQNSLSTLPSSSSTLPSSFSSSSLSTLPIIPPNTPNPIARWAIWSRRPQDPANAPSIIISPRARPPPDVVGSAMDLRMPVESRSASPVLVPGRKAGLPLGLGVGIGIEVDMESKKVEGKEKEKESVDGKQTKKEEEAVKEVENENEKEKEKEKEETGDETATATPSRTPATTVPCSPASSSTSISASASSAIPKVEEKKTTAEVADLVVEQQNEKISGSITPTPAPAPESTNANAMLAAPIPPSPTPSSSASASALTAIPAVVPPPAPAPAPSPVVPAKPKSWASLFNSAPSSTSASSSSTSGHVRNALPTSSVVGFSIPADSASALAHGKDQLGVAGHGISASRKSELLTLLTTGPAPLVPPPPVTVAAGGGGGINFAAAAAAGKAGKAPAASTSSSSSSVMRIRPRGLINSGNMCFANAVLQIMVYCPPFHRLFVELGRVLNLGGGSATASVLASVPSNGVNGNGVNDNGSAKQESATPLVDATIEFLREFLDEKDKATVPSSSSGAAPNVNGIANGSGSGTRNGSGASGSGGSGYAVARGGKGKEKEKEQERNNNNEDEYDWADGDAFLPSGIYDAMKTKKRFDSMRGGQQEDAEEFFGFYLDALEDELLAMLHAINPSRPSKQGAVVEEREEAAPADDAGWLEVGKRNRMVNTRTIKTTESPITRIFGGKFRTTLRTPGQKDSVIVEDWRSLRLDIQQNLRPGEKDTNVNNTSATGNNGVMSVQEALAGIAQPQQVQVQAGAGSTEVTAQQQVLIEALPPVLVLHVKRFLYDVKVGGTVKVGKQIRFGPELEIGAEIMVPAAKKSHPTRYKLFGVLYHHGLSASGGHYTLDVLHPNRYPSASTPKTREGWVRIDDNLVSDVRMDDVFGAWEKDESRCAYLLFYRRI